MTTYTFPRTTLTTISSDVAAKKAARRKVIEKARKLERDSYKAMMRRRRQLQAGSGLHPFYQTTGQVKSPNLRGIL